MNSGRWYEEMIDLRTGSARKTGLGAAYTTGAAALEHFNACRRLDVPAESGGFLLDLHDDRGDLVDTITLDVAGFAAIRGEDPAPPEVYVAHDQKVWRQARVYQAGVAGEAADAAREANEESAVPRGAKRLSRGEIKAALRAAFPSVAWSGSRSRMTYGQALNFSASVMRERETFEARVGGRHPVEDIDPVVAVRKAIQAARAALLAELDGLNRVASGP